MAPTLLESIDAFINTTYSRDAKTKKIANSLFKGRDTSGAKKPFAFLRQRPVLDLQNKLISDKAVVEGITLAIKESVTSYSKDKNTAIRIYQKYLAFLRTKYGIAVDVEFPLAFNSEFNRQMYIVKSLHQQKYSAADFADQLWTSEKTIESDIRDLEDGVDIVGQRLQIGREILIRKDKALNTIHPIFLAANLTQIVVILLGLEQMAKDQAYNEYAVRLAINIWNELSDYGRNRILTVSNQLGVTSDWFVQLDEKRNDRLYSSEEACSYHEGVGSVLDFLKNGKKCTIEFEDKDGLRILENCLIKRLDDDQLVILHEDVELQIKFSSIISTHEYGKHIY